MKHTCHAIGCNEAVPPKKLMCLKHWRMVPDEMKVQVYQAYVVGQCDSKRPTKLYLEVARRAITAVREQEYGKGFSQSETPEGER